MKRIISFGLFAFGFWLLTLSSCAQSRDSVKYDNANSQLLTANSKNWCYPLPGAKVISPYGARGGRTHSGTDLKTKPNDNILAAFDGEVVFSGTYYGYGNLVRIKHANGLETYYSHNSKNLVKEGDHVKAGDVIALTGRTGRATTEHLHFEIRINGQHVNSARFFDHATHQLRADAFKNTKDGYMTKYAKTSKTGKASKKAKTKKAKKSKKNKKTQKSRKNKKNKNRKK
jgi:murein DD-endopeptidase MepM/ murein hydrolase activator NlpD